MSARRSPERHEHHRRLTRARALASSADPPQTCAAVGCRKPTQRTVGDGFSTRYCRDHVEHLARHGSTWRTTPRKTELEPYRRAARRWLKANHARPVVQRVLAGLAGLLAAAGKSESAWSLRGLPPKERARIAMAKLREAKDAPDKLLVIALTIWSWLEAQGADGRFVEFRQVQIAKAAKRLASGTHKTRGGLTMPSKYPPSSGSYLRHMGRAIDDVAALIGERAWPEVLALVQQPAANDRPRPSPPQSTAAPSATPGATTAVDGGNGDEDERDRQWCIARWGRAEGKRMAAIRRRMRDEARGRTSKAL